MTDLRNTGNYQWSGNAYVGIPAGNITIIDGMLPQMHDSSKDMTGLQQLPTKNGYSLGANYFMERGMPYSIASLTSLQEPWKIIPDPCSSAQAMSCASPPEQFCSHLDCGPQSYPVYDKTCVSAIDLYKKVMMS
jgi:hypothetical protein